MSSPKAPLRLDYSRRQLGSGDPRQLTAGIPKGILSYEEVDFSLNNLSSASLTAVLDVCKRCPKLRVLKLFKNRLDDVGAEALADLCRTLPGIEEMHLSHNQFTAAGVKKLVVAAEEVRTPESTPLWLRLEQNVIDEPDEVFEQLEQLELSVCRRADDKSCTARFCCKKCKVHLPHFHLQRERYPNSGAGYSQAQSPPAASPATAKAAYRPPALPKPSMGASPAASPGGNSGWGSPTPQSATDKGAGKGKPGSNSASPFGIPKGNQKMAPGAPMATAVPTRSEVPGGIAGSQKVLKGGCPTSTLDERGARRILPEQMLDANSGSELVCKLCQCVILKPLLITKGSHLVCEPCFQSWVSTKVAEHKMGPSSAQPMPALPCPVTHEPLKKTDIVPLDRAQGPAAALLHRRWRNTQIRCIHHPDHFKHAFGKDAEWQRTLNGIECRWVGDLHAYESHLKQCCVECKLADVASGDKVGGLLGGEPFAEPEPVTSDTGEDNFEIREAKFDFETTGDPAQLALRAKDLVKIFEMTSSGWAAGIKVDRSTGVEIGDIGWFPVGYLRPGIITFP
eukprot:TRINITY_DN20311_c0_g2_i1.p1 TRINITY_DN20311_c0_g2~~TRINITY_DN20311_c0_g2_i1.p1  ORF type:complete len:566 (-),score=98.18 TRINITY_DN20311_c0_g2_i1:85-1782(-)